MQDLKGVASHSGPGKRKNQPAQIPERSSKKRRSSTICHEFDVFKAWSALKASEVQMANNLNEMMSHGVRNYATGWLLQDTTMTLWYADRMGLVHSAPFDIFRDRHLLLLFVAAVTCADLQKLGFCPLLSPSSQMTAERNFEGYDGAVLRLSEPEFDQEGNGVDRGELTFDVNQEHFIQTDYGTVGRGTTIVHVKASGTAATQFGSSRLVAKLAWPVLKQRRHGEDHLIRKIRTCLQKHKPEYLKHVVDLKASVSQRIEQINLPRALMADLPELSNSQNRVLCCLVMEEYSSLESVQSVEEFKTIFVDAVKGQT